MRVGAVWLSLSHPYYVAMRRHYHQPAKDRDFELMDLDGHFNPDTQSAAVRSLVDQRVDAILYCLVDPERAVDDIKHAQAAGVPIVTSSIKHGQAAKCPYVGIDEVKAGRLGGVAAGEFFAKRYAGRPARLVVVDWPGVQVAIDRGDGFVDGFRSVVPNAEVVAQVEGRTQRRVAHDAMQTVIAQHPELNVVYGIDDDAMLGALDALREAGRGTPETELVVGHDANEEAVVELVNPRSAVQVEMANRPRELAAGCQAAIEVMLEGKLRPDEDTTIYIEAVLLPDGHEVAQLQAFLQEQYFSEVDLARHAS